MCGKTISLNADERDPAPQEWINVTHVLFDKRVFGPREVVAPLRDVALGYHKSSNSRFRLTLTCQRRFNAPSWFRSKGLSGVLTVRRPSDRQTR